MISILAGLPVTSNIDPTCTDLASEFTSGQSLPDSFYMVLVIAVMVSLYIIGRGIPLAISMITENSTGNYKNTQRSRHINTATSCAASFASLAIPVMCYGFFDTIDGIVDLYRVDPFMGVIAWLVVGLNILTIEAAPIVTIWFVRHPAPEKVFVY